MNIVMHSVPQTAGISWLAEQLSASEGFCSMQLVILNIRKMMQLIIKYIPSNSQEENYKKNC